MALQPFQRAVEEAVGVAVLEGTRAVEAPDLTIQEPQALEQVALAAAAAAGRQAAITEEAEGAALASMERARLELLEQREHTLELEAAEARPVTAARLEQLPPRAERIPVAAVEATVEVGHVARHPGLVVAEHAASYGVRDAHSHPRTS